MASLDRVHKTDWEQALWKLAPNKYPEKREKIVTHCNDQLIRCREFSRTKGILTQEFVIEVALKERYIPILKMIMEQEWGLKCTLLYSLASKSYKYISLALPAAAIPPFNFTVPVLQEGSFSKFVNFAIHHGKHFADCTIALHNADGKLNHTYQKHGLIIAQLSDKISTHLEKDKKLSFTIGENGCTAQSLEWLISYAYALNLKESKVIDEWKERYTFAFSLDCHLAVEACRVALIECYQEALVAAASEKDEQKIQTIIEQIQNFAMEKKDEKLSQLAMWAKSDPFWRLQPLS